MNDYIEPVMSIDEALRLVREHARTQYRLELVCVLSANFHTREGMEWSRDFNRRQAERTGRAVIETYQTRIEDHWLIWLVDELGGYSVTASGRKDRGGISFAVYADGLVEVVHAPSQCGKLRSSSTEPGSDPGPRRRSPDPR